MSDGQRDQEARDCSRAPGGDCVLAAQICQLAEQLGAALTARGWRVTAAESCTGGLLCGALTSVPGASNYLHSSYVVYSNAAKTRELGVSEALLAAHGAVSEPVVKAMAEGARARAGAELACAISGVAGPGGGSPAKPVGTVWLAVAGPAGCRAERHQLPGDREAVRQGAVMAALAALLVELELYK